MSIAPIILLDRDGTINIDRGYVCRVEEVELVPGAARGVAMLRKAGALVIVISNQSAIGRGMCQMEDVVAVNAQIQSLLAAANPDAILSGIFFCPHRPEEGCACRKPRPGMIEQVRAQWKFDPETAWMVGDKVTDAQFGHNVGIPEGRCFLIGEVPSSELPRGRVVASLLEAAELICKDLSSN